ncbi:Uncharacterised protein [Brucella melitensis]|nr:Uncharacterised protein [Brucella melitensis]
MAFQPAAQPVEITDLAVMHEAPAARFKRVAVRPAGKPAGGSTHMRKKKARAYLPRQTAEVLIGPGGKNIPVKARLAAMPIPSNAKAVTIGAGLGLMRIMALRHERMTGRRYNCLPDRFQVRDKRPNDTFSIRFQDDLPDRLCRTNHSKFMNFRAPSGLSGPYYASAHIAGER